MNTDKEKIKDAINYAVNHENYKNTNPSLVDLVRQYFNKNDINYESFSFEDIEPYIEWNNSKKM